MKIYNNKVALLGDLHLGVHLSSNTWHDISLDFCKWFKQQLIDNDIKDIIILGDVLDNRVFIPVYTLHILTEFFKILEDFNIIIITGNHDCYYNKNSEIHSLGVLNDWSNITIIDKYVNITSHNKKLSFCPWGTDLNEVQPSDIMFGHFEIQTFKMANKKICEHGIETKNILKNASLTVSGHFHNTELREYNDGKILYVGTPFEQSWGEAYVKKGFYILDMIESDISFVENTISPKHIKIKLSEILSVGKITDNIKKEIINNFVILIIDEEVDQKTIDKLITKLQLLKPLHIKYDNIIQNQTILSLDDEIKVEGIDIKEDILQYISNIKDLKNKEDVVKYIIDTFNKCEAKE